MSQKSQSTGRKAILTFVWQTICVRLSRNGRLPPQKAPRSYLGGPYFKITIAGTDRALAAIEGGELVSVPEFTGAPEQLWRIDQLTDGTWRIMPKSIPKTDVKMALSAIGHSFATLEKFDSKSDKQRWIFNLP
jgi:arabinan endo-1,5-alpha-L-arabinosidase